MRDMDDAAIAKWRELAQATAWKDYAERNQACAALLKLAQTTA